MTWMVIERPQVKPYKPFYEMVRRVIDIILCLSVAIFLIPVAFIVAIAVRFDSSGPIFFVQERVGKGGRLFKIVKFRTMHHNLDISSHQAFMKDFVNGRIKQSQEEHKVFKPFSASQVTRVGRVLRKTSLDELPQLINVLKGEMTLVGPRPNVPWEVEEYHTWHKERLEVLPGITGLAQVRGRSGITFDEIVKHDIEYIKNRGLKLDFQILWWTVSSVIFGTGAH